jgi:hypothetical protein
MGIWLANQKRVSIKHIIEFKENLRIILISTLFIVLAARLQVNDFYQFNWNTLIFLVVLIFIARPLSVFVSTIGLGMQLREKFFLSWLAPRGIVAAAVSSVFAIELSAMGYAEAERLIPLTFLVIIATVTIYGLSAVPLARLLKLSDPDPQGVLIVGAHSWSRKLARVLKSMDFRVLLVDSNPDNVDQALAEGIDTANANILSEDVVDQLNLQGIGKLFAVTQNDEVNALAALHLEDVFGRAEVYQLPYKKKKISEEQRMSRHLRGRCLFERDPDSDKLQAVFSDDARIKVLNFETTEDINAYDEQKMLPIVLIDAQNTLLVYTDEQPPKPVPESKLIYQEIG